MWFLLLSLLPSDCGIVGPALKPASCLLERQPGPHTTGKFQDLDLFLSWDAVWPSIPFSLCSHRAHRLGFMQLLSSQSSPSILSFWIVQTGSWVVDGVDSDARPTPSLIPQSKKHEAEGWGAQLIVFAVGPEFRSPLSQESEVGISSRDRAHRPAKFSERLHLRK